MCGGIWKRDGLHELSLYPYVDACIRFSGAVYYLHHIKQEYTTLKAEKQKASSVTVHARLKPENHEWLADEAIKLDRSISWLIDHLVERARLEQTKQESQNEH